MCLGMHKYPSFATFSMFVIVLLPRLRQRRVLYRTLTFNNKEKILVVAATQRDVLQQDFEAGTPSIENSCMQTANSKQQTRNSNETMARNLTCQRGMTKAQLPACKVEEQQTSEQPRRDSTAARPQLCKVEANNNKQHRTNQRASINQ